MQQGSIHAVDSSKSMIPIDDVYTRIHALEEAIVNKFPVSIDDGGTGATSAAMARATLGAAAEWDLIYTNSNPTSISEGIFATVDAKYNTFLIYTASKVNIPDAISSNDSHLLFIFNDTLNFENTFNLYTLDPFSDYTDIYTYLRKCTITKIEDPDNVGSYVTKFYVGGGYYKYGGIINTDSTILVPFRIYGTVI